jgi:hypothetical protein
MWQLQTRVVEIIMIAIRDDGILLVVSMLSAHMCSKHLGMTSLRIRDSRKQIVIPVHAHGMVPAYQSP